MKKTNHTEESLVDLARLVIKNIDIDTARKIVTLDQPGAMDEIPLCVQTLRDTYGYRVNYQCIIKFPDNG